MNRGQFVCLCLAATPSICMLICPAVCCFTFLGFRALLNTTDTQLLRDFTLYGVALFLKAAVDLLVCCHIKYGLPVCTCSDCISDVGQGIRIALTDGNSHAVDSSEMAFKLACLYAFRDAFLRASPVVLEPIMTVEVSHPPSQAGCLGNCSCSCTGKALHCILC